MSDDADPAGEEADKASLRRTFDFCVAAPVGVAVSVVEELPDLIAKGRRRVELHLGNALVVGRYVVGKGQRTVSKRLEDLWSTDTDAAPDPEPTATSSEPPQPPSRTPPDPAAEAVVAAALADYDTLSASQVVRRLESLGPDQLRAVQRYEASTRNRRTILNRAGQLLEERPAGPTHD